MNLVFLLLLVAALVAGAVTGNVKAVGQGALDGAANGVTLALGLIGVMALWLGLLKIAEKAGLVEKLARIFRPIFRPLFPGVPDGHPAISAMVLNIAANMLGLGNAATPFGLKAMEELDKLNENKGTATNAQALFLAMNTACIQLIPTTVLAMRVAARSKDPAEILVPTAICTVIAFTVAVVVAKLLERVWR
jgi:spore maturation protein A